MAYPNEGPIDRTLRIIVGLVLLYLGWQAGTATTAGIVMLVIGAIALITGVVGWCGAYAVFGWSTFRKKA